MTEAIKSIVCPECGARADRVGAQDACDIYVCSKEIVESEPGIPLEYTTRHVTRIKIYESRTEWKDE